MRCMADSTATCSELNTWLSQADKTTPSLFIQCMATCDNPWPAPMTSPVFGLTACITETNANGGCGTEVTACIDATTGDPDCDAWVDCTTTNNQCQSPECFESCTQLHGTNTTLQDLLSCSCDIAQNPGQIAASQACNIGTGDCSDIAIGVMDPCQQLAVAQSL